MGKDDMLDESWIWKTSSWLSVAEWTKDPAFATVPVKKNGLKPLESDRSRKKYHKERRVEMEILIRRAVMQDVDTLEDFYNQVNDYLAAHTNYPGWRRDVYPTREDAVQGVQDDCLYVATDNGKIAASMILRQKSEPAYETTKWQLQLKDEEIYVVHTFAVAPQYFGSGVSQRMLRFAEEQGRKAHVKALRLDVYEKNVPAIRLYQKCGFRYMDTVDLGLGQYGLKWFQLYEKLL